MNMQLSKLEILYNNNLKENSENIELEDINLILNTL